MFKFANFVGTELEEGISAGATEMNIPLAASQALPLTESPDEIRLVLWDGQQEPEIVGAQNPQTGVLTITRAKEDTTAKAWTAGTQVKCVLTAEIINTALAAFFDITTVLNASFLKLSGGTLTGALVLSGAPSDALHAATKAYVDSIGQGFLPSTGGALTGTLNMGGNLLIGLPTPATPTSAATKSYVDSVATSAIKWKEPVAAATTENGTLSTAFADGSEIDGVTLATGDRILIKDQTDASQNGIYVVQATGSPERATDADAGAEIPGSTVFVEDGTANAATQWTCKNTAVTLGSTDIEFVLIAAGVLYTADDITMDLAGNVFSVKSSGISATQLNTDAVETAKIKDGNVTNDKIADTTIAFGKLATTAIADESTAEAGASSATLLTPQRGRQLVKKTPGVWNIIDVRTIDNDTNIDFTSLGSFDEIELIITQLRPQNNGAYLGLRVRQAGSFVTSDNYFCQFSGSYAGGGGFSFEAVDGEMQLTDNLRNVANNPFFCRVNIIRPVSSGAKCINAYSSSVNEDTHFQQATVMCVMNLNTSAFDGLRLFDIEGGTLISGRAMLRGMYHS